MKKNIKNLSFIIILLFCIINLKNVYAYNLVTDSKFIEGTTSAAGYKPIEFSTMVANVDQSGSSDDNSPGDNTGSSEGFDTKAILFYDYSSDGETTMTNHFNGSSPKTSFAWMNNDGSGSAGSVSTDGNPDSPSRYVKSSDFSIHDNTSDYLTTATYRFNNGDIVQYLIDRFDLKAKLQEVQKSNPNEHKVKLRFSNVTATTFGNYSLKSIDNQNMQALWQYYGVTRNVFGADHNFWNRDRGYPENDGSGSAYLNNYVDEHDNTSDKPSYMYSVANIYDNILTIPLGDVISRKVYVRHIYKDPIDNSLHLLDTSGYVSGDSSKYKGTGSNIGGYNPNGFTSQEYYEISTSDNLTLSKDNKDVIGSRKLQYVGYKKATANTQADAQNALSGLVGYTGGGASVTIGSSNQADVTFVDFYYELLPPTPAATVKGRLGFTTTDSSYSGAKTTSTTEQTQYIPSGKIVKPYVSDAYPYLLDNIRYSREYETRNVGGKNVTVVYYKINNVDLWTIDHATLHDSSGNKGGLLFGNYSSDYTLNTSQSYKNRVSINIIQPTINISGNTITVTNGGVQVGGVNVIDTSSISVGSPRRWTNN